jgi:GNAT superfamily N-acetyltransferase
MVPFAWDGTYAGLPKTVADMVQLALEHKCSGVRPNALGALQVVVDPTQQGQGLSARMLEGMAAIAAAHGFSDLFAPIRPSQKHRYPLTTLDRYATWTRADGLPIDPWQRTHARLGATPAGVVDGWVTVTGSAAEWARWTGMMFPESGSYIIPGGLAPLEIDLERGVGCYREPHLWMHHRVAPVGGTRRSATSTLTLLADRATAVETVPVAGLRTQPRIPVPAARASRYVACRYV